MYRDKTKFSCQFRLKLIILNKYFTLKYSQTEKMQDIVNMLNNPYKFNGSNMHE